MEKIVEYKLCNGCTACSNSCPMGAISMKENLDGFLYPFIDQSKCTDCGICQKKCPILNQKSNFKMSKAYACYNNNDKERLNSSSGGIFILIAKKVIENGGVVFGVSFDDKFSVSHNYAESIEGLSDFMGSKYLQSDLKDSFLKVKDFLKSGRTVLFSGTPCQIGGLKAFLKRDYDNLITQDIVCHGCPSPKLWKKYLSTYGNSEDISKVSFREKSKGWHNFSFFIKTKNNDFIDSHGDNKYMYLFLKNFCLRKSCYNCSFKNKYRDSDLTLGDFWGIENVFPEMDDDKGISLLVINSVKGEKTFEELKEQMTYRETDLDAAISYNTAYVESCAEPKNRLAFFKDLDKKKFDKLYKKYYIKDPFLTNIKRYVKRKIKRILKIVGFKYE
jgi:coenzyme F420-reducing hydrogenase beta subunit